MEGVFIQKEYRDRVEVIYARQAYHQVDETTGKRLLVCLDTHAYKLSRNEKDVRFLHFVEVVVHSVNKHRGK